MMDEYSDQIWHCSECGRECTYHEETFGYTGTHCNFGRPGIHSTGVMRSDCCEADITLFPEGDEE